MSALDSLNESDNIDQKPWVLDQVEYYASLYPVGSETIWHRLSNVFTCTISEKGFLDVDDIDKCIAWAINPDHKQVNAIGEYISSKRNIGSEIYPFIEAFLKINTGREIETVTSIQALPKGTVLLKTVSNCGFSYLIHDEKGNTVVISTDLYSRTINPGINSKNNGNYDLYVSSQDVFSHYKLASSLLYRWMSLAEEYGRQSIWAKLSDGMRKCNRLDGEREAGPVKMNNLLLCLEQALKEREVLLLPSQEESGIIGPSFVKSVWDVRNRNTSAVYCYKAGNMEAVTIARVSKSNGKVEKTTYFIQDIYGNECTIAFWKDIKGQAFLEQQVSVDPDADVVIAFPRRYCV